MNVVHWLASDSLRLVTAVCRASDILRKAAILRTELKQVALSREPLIGLAAALSYSDREEDRARSARNHRTHVTDFPNRKRIWYG